MEEINERYGQVKYDFKIIILSFALLALVSSCGQEQIAEGGAESNVSLPVPENVRAASRQWRVDLYWAEGDLWRKDPQTYYEVQRAVKPEGPFETINDGFVKIPAYTDFFGKPANEHYYRVRMIKHTYKPKAEKAELDEANPTFLKAKLIAPAEEGELVAVSPWSKVVSAGATEFDEDKFLLELQEVSFLYTWNLAHPVSGMPSEMLPGWNRNLTGTSATGFSIYNYIVGVERGYITRQQGAQRLLKMTEFLLNKVETFWGVYPHWLNAQTGEIIPLSPGNDGSDLLETAFMVMGLIGAREYFDGNTATEQQLRDNVNKIWGNVDWTSHAAVRPDGM
ncbi:MAG: hypothetical protein ACYSPI_00085, partial [Planctomycetota bacterium]